MAASLGALPPGPREAAIASLIAKHGGDPIVLDAALSGARGIEEALVGRAEAGGAASAARETAITMAADLVVRGAGETAVQNLFEQIADETRPAWQRSALLRRAEVALLGSQMPGTAARRGGPALRAPPCPTCPGARSGLGGGYAFPEVRKALQVPGRGTGRGGGPGLRLNREPTALATLADRGDDLGERVAAVIARACDTS